MMLIAGRSLKAISFGTALFASGGEDGNLRTGAFPPVVNLPKITVEIRMSPEPPMVLLQLVSALLGSEVEHLASAEGYRRGMNVTRAPLFAPP